MTEVFPSGPREKNKRAGQGKTIDPGGFPRGHQPWRQSQYTALERKKDGASNWDNVQTMGTPIIANHLELMPNKKSEDCSMVP